MPEESQTTTGIRNYIIRTFALTVNSVRAIYLYITILFLSGCGVLKPKHDATNADIPKILFVSGKLNKTENGIAITHLNFIQKPGSIKPNNNHSYFSPFLLKAVLLNQHKALDSIIIDHPMYKHFEFEGPNRQLLQKDTVLTQAQFFFRFQNKGNGLFIRLEEKTDAKGWRDMGFFPILVKD